MSAMLERHPKNGKPTPSNIPAKETIPCSDSDCEIAYTLSYTDGENFVDVTGTGELNTVAMRRLAVALIEKEHPAHLTKTHLWKGRERGWLEADSMAARKAL